MRALAATVVACALLSTSCAFARRHPRLTTATLVSVAAALVIGAPLEHECTPQPGRACGPERAALIFGISTAVGALAGLWIYSKATEPQDVVEAAAPLRRRIGTPRSLQHEPIPAIAAASTPTTWLIPLKVPTSPLGRAPIRRAAHAGSSGLMSACVGAKRAVFDELEAACTPTTRHVGVATHTAATAPCECQATTHGYACFSAAEATCATIPDDLAVLGTAAAATRVVAEATAVQAARQRCWSAGATSTSPAIACECDAALGAPSQTCGCIAAVDCGP